jgi:hypothetical protein
MPRTLLIRPWSDCERETLRKLFEMGLDVAHIARRIRRSQSSVRHLSTEMGLSFRARQLSSPTPFGHEGRPPASNVISTD